MAMNCPDEIQKLYSADHQQTIIKDLQAWKHKPNEPFKLDVELTNRLIEANTNGNESKLEAKV